VNKITILGDYQLNGIHYPPYLLFDKRNDYLNKNNMNLEEYNKQKYQNWVEKINLDNIRPNCPKCSSKIQEIPNSATGNPKQVKIECPKCKYKGIKIL